MPFFTTSPMSKMQPIIEEALRGTPVTASVASAPTTASGTDARTTTAIRERRNCAKQHGQDSQQAESETRARSRKVSCWARYWPPSSLV